MKTASTLGLALACAFLLQPRSALFGQGDLTPPGAPAPTMKSLQEIWEKIGALETQVTGLETQNSLLQSQNALLQRQLGLLAASTVNFAWVVSTIGEGNVPSLAFGPDGQPAIAYGFEAVVLARFDGTAWTSTAVPGATGGNPSLAFGPDGYPAIAYSAGGGGVRCARFDGASWSVTVVDTVGSYPPSLAFGPDGLPGIAYTIYSQSAVKYAGFDGTDWLPETADVVDVGNHASLAFAPDGRPFISYHVRGSYPAQNVKIARRNGSVWTTSVAATDQSYSSTTPTSLAFGPDGQPAIAFGDDDAQRIYVARYSGTVWTKTTVAVAYGDYYSLAFAPDGQPTLAFQSIGSYDLLFSRYAGGLDGPAWVGTVVDAAGDQGFSASMAYGPDGQPAIAYVDYPTLGVGLLKFARKGVFKVGP